MGCSQGLDTVSESNFNVLISDQNIEAQTIIHQSHLQKNTVFHQKSVFPEPETNQTHDNTDQSDHQISKSANLKKLNTNISTIKRGSQRPSLDSQQSMQGIINLLHNYNNQNNHNNHNNDFEKTQKQYKIESRGKSKQKKGRINMADLEQQF